MREIVIDKTLEGGRLDKFVLNYLGDVSKGFVYKQLRKKNIVLNDKKAEGNEILKSGDSLKIYFSESTFENFKASSSKRTDALPIIDFKKFIVYEDDNIIALNKPVGMLSQKAKPEDISLNEYLIEYITGETFYMSKTASNDISCKNNSEIITGISNKLNEVKDEQHFFKPGISNRLDRNTSGLILAGKNPAAARALNLTIKERTIEKKYWCIVKGNIDKPQRIEGYLAKDFKNNKVFILKECPNENDLNDYIKDKNMFFKNSDFKPEKIITEYYPLQTNGFETLLEVNLITGKSHQIRAHLASIGHSLAGDFKYGDDDFNSYFRDKYKLKNQLLHARSIEFNDMTGILEYLNEKRIMAELPEKFKNILTGEKLWPHGKAED